MTRILQGVPTAVPVLTLYMGVPSPFFFFEAVAAP